MNSSARPSAAAASARSGGSTSVGERAAQVLDRRRAAAHDLGEARLEQQRRALVGRRRLVERTPQERGAALGRSTAQGGAGRGAQHLDDPWLRLARRAQQVARDLLGGRPGGVQHARGARVLQLALARRQREQDGVGDERVHECQRRLGAQDLGAGQRTGGRGDPWLVDLGEARGLRDGHAIAQDGHRSRDRERVGRQPREAHADRARDGSRADGAHEPRAGGERSHAVGLERARELADEQRVAARRGQACLDERGLRSLPEPVADQAGDAARAQRAGADELRRRLADRAEQVVVDIGFAGADRCQHEHGEILDAAREIGQQPQRRTVGPLQVVDGEQQRALRGEVEDRPEEAVQRGEATVHRKSGRVGERVGEDRAGRLGQLAVARR